MEKITGYLIDTKVNTSGVVTIDHDCDAFCRTLHCDLFDVASLTIHGEEFDVICDDAALLYDRPVVSACYTNGEPKHVGSILLLRFDGIDSEMSLSDDDIRLIESRVRLYADVLDPAKPVLRKVVVADA